MGRLPITLGGTSGKPEGIRTVNACQRTRSEGEPMFHPYTLLIVDFCEGIVRHSHYADERPARIHCRSIGIEHDCLDSRRSFRGTEPAGTGRSLALTISPRGQQKMRDAFPLWQNAQGEVDRLFGIQKANSLRKALREVSTLA
jgi:hypothetical protein